MKRGKFIMTGAAVLMVPFVKSMPPSNQNVPAGFTVKSGETRNGKHFRMKGVTLNQLDLKISSADTNGAISVFEQTGMTPNGGPPLHIHPNQDEFFYVIEGEYLFRVGDKQHNLSVGDTIFLPRNIPHAFIQLTDKARVLVSYTPAGRMEDFFAVTDSWINAPDQELIRKTFADHDMIVVGPPLKV